MRAQAVVAIAPWQVEFKEIEVPDPGPQDVVLRVIHSWISNGTESSFVRGERIAGDTSRKESDPMPFPHVPGYQKVGVVEWVGEEVEGLQIGDRAFASVSRVESMYFSSGGHVSPAVTAASQVWKLPDKVDSDEASGLILTQVGYNVGIRPEVRPGDTAVVIGDGMVGHWSAQTLQSRGARVLLVGRHEDRLTRLALREGDLVINAARVADMTAEARQWAGERGVQVVVDTVGSITAIETLIPVMRRFGHIVSAGFYGINGQLDVQKLRDRELTLHAPAGWTRERVEATLTMLAEEKLTTGHLITHRFPVAQATQAFDLILSRRAGVLGVVLDWEGDDT